MDWREDVVTAFRNLGGEADLADVYAEIEGIRSELGSTWRATVRRTIEENSSDSQVWSAGTPDLFEKVGRGRWALRSSKKHPKISEIMDQITRRDITDAFTKLASGVKHAFGDSTKYDVVHEGHRYPPKAVIGLAASRLLGRSLAPDEFSGGMNSQCSRVLRMHGFDVVAKPTSFGTSSTDVSLPEEVHGNVLMEITKSNHGHGGAGWEFGSCLWSPSTARGGRDWYTTMRESQPGDLVIHCQDSQLTGFSFVASPYREVSDPPPSPGPWADRKSYYRIDLRDYTPFYIPVSLSDFLKNFGKQVREDICDASVGIGQTLRLGYF